MAALVHEKNSSIVNDSVSVKCCYPFKNVLNAILYLTFSVPHLQSCVQCCGNACLLFMVQVVLDDTAAISLID